MVITEEMRKTYEIVKHQYLLEDGQYQVETFLEWNEDYKPYEEVISHSLSQKIIDNSERNI